MKLGTQTGSLINHVVSNAKDVSPRIGVGATMLHWTDRTACTIVAVKYTKKGAPKMITVQRDIATRTDKNGMSYCQQYEYKHDATAPLEYFTLRSNGKWIKLGESANGLMLKIGARDQHYDFSF